MTTAKIDSETVRRMLAALIAGAEIDADMRAVARALGACIAERYNWKELKPMNRGWCAQAAVRSGVPIDDLAVQEAIKASDRPLYWLRLCECAEVKQRYAKRKAQTK